MSLLLSREERERFAAWCLMSAKSDNEMAAQILLLSEKRNTGFEDPMARRMKQRATAYAIVALELRETEDMEIGPYDS